MKAITRTLPVAVLALSAAVSYAADVPTAAPPPAPNAPAAADSAAQPPPEVQIPFADHGGIYNWQVVDNRTVLIEGRNRKWYKATLFSPCFDLPFTERLGFKSNPGGSFDKFSSIQVRHQRCPLTSLVESAAPPKKAKAKKTGAPAATSSTPPAAAAPSTPPQ